jgi:hypothetical protein
MLVAPHQFAAPVYVPLQPQLHLCGYLFLGAGASMIAVATLDVRGLWFSRPTRAWN